MPRAEGKAARVQLNAKVISMNASNFLELLFNTRPSNAHVIRNLSVIGEI
jgi:hypothetical protein